MATVELTIEQILDAVVQLSPTERKRLQREMTRLESSAKPRKRMPRRETKRMSELLLKANSGLLSAEEDAELNALVDDFESLTLENAKAMAQRENACGDRPSRPRRSAKR